MPVPIHLKEIITNLQESSGFYKFLDVNGNLLYIGKSKNFIKQVTSYFRNQNGGKYLVTDKSQNKLITYQKTNYSYLNV